MSKAKKEFLIKLSLFFSLAALLFALFFAPNALAIRKMMNDVKNDKKNSLEISERKNDLESLKEKLSLNEEYIKKMQERLISEDNLENIAVVLENLAESISVKQEISSLRQPQTAVPGAVYFKNIARGKFNDVMKYMKGVENLKYISEIDSCSFSKSLNGEIKAEIILVVPIYKDNIN